MQKFTKAEMIEELREIIYQYARAACFVLDPAAGYRMLFRKDPANSDDTLHFMNPEVYSTTTDMPFSIDDFQITGTVGQFYDYGLNGIRNFPPVGTSGSNEWTFAYGLIIDSAGSFLISESCNGDYVTVEKCLHAAKAFFARLVLDGGERSWVSLDHPPEGMLSIPEVALLAGLDERTVRNATSKSAANRLDTAVVDSSIYIPREAAIQWLSTKRGFIPSRVGDELPAETVLETQLANAGEAGDFVRQQRERLKLSIIDLASAPGCSLSSAEVEALEAGKIIDDEENLTAIGKALGFNGSLFALRLIEVKQKQAMINLQNRISAAKV